MAFAGVPLASLRHVFITHQHSDHTADYGNLIWLAWTAGLSSRVDTWGPPPLERMTRLFLEMNQSDIDIRIDASDVTVDLEVADVDLALRYGPATRMPPEADRMFGEVPDVQEHADRREEQHGEGGDF